MTLKALAAFALELFQSLKLSMCFYTFGDNSQAQIPRQCDDRPNDHVIIAVVVDH